MRECDHDWWVVGPADMKIIHIDGKQYDRITWTCDQCGKHEVELQEADSELVAAWTSPNTGEPE